MQPEKSTLTLAQTDAPAAVPKKKQSTIKMAPKPAGGRPAVGAGAKRANGTLFSPMDSKKRPSVPQRKQILAGGSFAKSEPDAGEDDETYDMPDVDMPDEDDMGTRAQSPGAKEEDGEDGGKQSGGFAPAAAQEKNKSGLNKLQEVDGWRAMRDAVALEAEQEVESEAAGETEAKAEMAEGTSNLSKGELGLPLEEDGSLNMFWIDAYEDSSKAGRIYMFGKSCQRADCRFPAHSLARSRCSCLLWSGNACSLEGDRQSADWRGQDWSSVLLVLPSDRKLATPGLHPAARQDSWSRWRGDRARRVDDGSRLPRVQPDSAPERDQEAQVQGHKPLLHVPLPGP